MKETESQYFELLRSALWETPLEIKGEIDWKALVDISKHHATTALICDVATKMTGDNKPSDKALQWMKGQMRGNLAFQMRLKQTMLTAFQMLREHDIEPVLLKGFGLAVNYPNPYLRQCGDVDIFIGLEKFHEACEVLRGMPGSYNWDMEVDLGRHYNVEFGDYAIEIHRVSHDIVEPKENARYLEIEKEGLFLEAQHIYFEGNDISIPSKEFVVFFTFIHAWHHFLTSGVGWRQICDIAMALHAYRDQLDLEKLEGYFVTMNLLKPWQAFGFLMVEKLGLPQGEMPFYDAKSARKAEKVFRLVMKEGNFHRNRAFQMKRPKRYLAQKIHSIVCVFANFFHMVGIFPSLAFHELTTSLRLGFSKVHKQLTKQ